MVEQQFEVVYRREEKFIADVKCPQCSRALQCVGGEQGKFSHHCPSCGLTATLSDKFPKVSTKVYPGHSVADKFSR